MSSLSRRGFLSHAAGLSAAAVAAPSVLGEVKKGSANDRLRVAVVGVKGRGMSHVGGFIGGKKNAALNTVITHVCDCDEGVIGGAMKKIKDDQGDAPTFVKDFRKLIDDKDIDIISIATPNHWHALMAVWAMRAGKDVYVEKPVSHNVREGRLMVEAARKYGKICQTGTQSRSTAGMRQSMDYIHAGKIGKVSLSYGTCYKRRKSIGMVTAPSTPPKGMDYDLWCGPAPKLAIARQNVHYDWHWMWAYGNGDLGNQGIHEMDKARWGLNKTGMPKSVVSVGGRFGYLDDGETANTQLCVFDYGDAKLVFEVRGLESISPFPAAMGPGKKGDNFVGNVFYGSEGTVVCPSYSSGIVFDMDGKKVSEFKGGGEDSHFANFIKAVRSRKYADLNADIEQGHLSSALCHLGNISYRLGAETTMDKAAGDVAESKESAAALTRMKEHLTANGVDLKTAVGRAGPKLMIEPGTESFAGAPAAAKDMLSREYRKGFDINEGA